MALKCLHPSKQEREASAKETKKRAKQLKKHAAKAKSRAKKRDLKESATSIAKEVGLAAQRVASNFTEAGQGGGPEKNALM